MGMMKLNHAHGMRVGTVMAALVAAVLAGGPAGAQQISLSGAWSGSGTVSLPSGNAETVRCRATFRQSGTSATMNATCANASTRVTQTAELTRVAGNRFTGDFFNPEFGVSGSIRIVVNGNSLSASLNGGGGTAQISLSR